MCREHGTELEACKGRPDAVDVDAVLRYSVQGVSQECSLRSPGLAELGCAVVSAERVRALELVDEVVRVAVAAGGASVVGIAKDAITFSEEPQPIAAIDERTGAGDKAQGADGDDDWIPAAWREEAT